MHVSRVPLKTLGRRTVATRITSLVTSVSVVTAALVWTSAGTASGDVARRSVPPVTAVGVAHCTFVDDTRPVLNYSTTPSSILSTSRTLVTEIRYPTRQLSPRTHDIIDATPLGRSGGYPTIVFAHGYDVTPDTYAPLLDAWVRAGFVVVAPYFPDEKVSAVTAQNGVNTEGDLANEPADVTFVTRAILTASATLTANCPIVRALVRPIQITLAGHSDGADALAMLLYDQAKDPQGIAFSHLREGIDYRALILMAGEEARHQSYGATTGAPPLLVIQSLADTCNPVANSVRIYDSVRQTDKWFLELRIAHHLPPFDGRDRSDFKVVTTTSIEFLRESLRIASTPINLVALGNRNPRLARIYVGGRGPSLKNAPTLPESCGPN